MSFQDLNAIRRNEAKREAHGQQSRMNAETRIAKQLKAEDKGISWTEALRVAKNLLDALPHDASFDSLSLDDLQGTLDSLPQP